MVVGWKIVAKSFYLETLWYGSVLLSSIFYRILCLNKKADLGAKLGYVLQPGNGTNIL